MIWRLLLFELVLVLVVVGVWLLGPLVGIESVAWRVVIILALVLPPIVVVIWKLIARRRADKGLANAMREQGQAHEDNVRPDRKEEINALNEAFNQALGGLRKSRLGGRGSSLYALPWFMIIGPPAAGKSTALLRSGLRFPFTPGDRKAVRGVGGTRNCDWWFSDQAILLDTAGRYSTQDDDQEEWTAFLRMLRKYRRKQPLNGLIVAIAVSDILTAKPNELEELAHQVRSRVDQVIADLELSLPIYLLFTKCDLISGFVEFFGDLKKSRRSQIFGFTTPLTDTRTDIESLFATEFDILADQVRKRGLSRLASARPQQRTAVFQFPLQFTSIREPLKTFTGFLLGANPYQDSPQLRGVYFCSGTQEGRPIDRVMATMGRALGLRDLGGQALPEQATKKSYFLHDVFTDVLVPDRELAGRTETGLRRRGRLRAAGLVAAMLFSAGAIGLATTTFSKNRALLSTSKDVAKKSRITTPEDPRKVTNSLKALHKLGAQVDNLRNYETEGVPFSLGLGFYQGSRIFSPSEQLLIKRTRQAMVLPAGSELEATLTDIANASDIKVKGAARDFDLLKTYLMVTNPKRLKVEFAVNILLEQWKKRLHPDVAQENDLLEKIATRYLKLVKVRKATWLDRDDDLIRNVRQALKARDADYRSVLGDNVDSRFRPFTLRNALRGRIQT
ncbi:MAG: type VI secretion system membrane subunit TssM, partial [Deltaproteobacteria bacterium]|nr:type VI secretion system membrane subunit TssM [Deltaproteobacteria bacterium]